jgi:DNA-binding HxlR family transcriptional regulator
MPRKAPAPFSYEGLDRVIHEKARLGIMTSLAGQPKGLSFADLKRLCGLTDGNLSRHLQVLEEGGCVRIDKGYEGKRPLTTCRLTQAGKARFSAPMSATLTTATAIHPAKNGRGRHFGSQRRSARGRRSLPARSRRHHGGLADSMSRTHLSLKFFVLFFKASVAGKRLLARQQAEPEGDD